WERLPAALDHVLPPIFKQIFDMAAKDKPKSKLRIEPAGTRTVAGHQGQVYRAYGLDDSKPTEATEMVLSREPELQPAGQAMTQFSISTVVLMAPLLGQAAAEMVTDMRTLFSYGAPLDIGQFKLEWMQTA